MHCVRMVEGRIAEYLAGTGKPDPVRLFVKREPHKLTKVALGRWRLIWSVPFVESVIDKLIWQAMVAAEVNALYKIPSVVGFSPFKGGYNHLYRELDYDGEFREEDKAHWDFTYSFWLLSWNVELRFRLCIGAPDDWFSMAKIRRDNAYKGFVIFSDGVMLEQILAGIMRSGSFTTLSFNSSGMVMSKILVKINLGEDFSVSKDKIFAVGDDSFERDGYLSSNEAVKQAYLNLGIYLKEFKVGKLTDITFCSRRVVLAPNSSMLVPIPLNWNKHVHALRYGEPSKHKNLPDAVFSLMMEYAFSPREFEILSSVLKQVAPTKVRSKEWCQYMLTGFESAPGHVFSLDLFFRPKKFGFEGDEHGCEFTTHTFKKRRASRVSVNRVIDSVRDVDEAT